MATPKSLAKETVTITPMNGFIRIKVTDVKENNMHGIVTDASKGTQCKIGDDVYFPKTAALLVKFNGGEDVFIKEDEIIFRIGE